MKWVSICLAFFVFHSKCDVERCSTNFIWPTKCYCVYGLSLFLSNFLERVTDETVQMSICKHPQSNKKKGSINKFNDFLSAGQQKKKRFCLRIGMAGVEGEGTLHFFYEIESRRSTLWTLRIIEIHASKWQYVNIIAILRNQS